MEHDALFLLVKKPFEIFVNVLKATLTKHKSSGDHLPKQKHIIVIEVILLP
jgi:hypothetical protein